MMFFNDLKISAKLLVGFVLLLVLTAFIGIFSIYELASVNNSATQLGTNWMPSVKAALGIKERVSRIRSQEAQMVFAENQEEVDKYMSRVKEAITGLKENEVAYSALISEPEERALYADYTKNASEYLKITDKMIALKKADNSAEAVALLRGESSQVNTKMRDIVDKIVDINDNGGIKAYQSGISVYEHSRTLILILLVASLVIGLTLAFWLAGVVSRPLQHAVKVAQTVAAGDLTSLIEVHSSDETGLLLQALKDMNTSLLGVVTQVRKGTDQIHHSSAEIAQGNLDLSNRTENQASSLEETASSMEEITSTIQHNADNARQANQLSHSASEVAQRGGNVVSQVVSTMGSINESSKKIVDIIAVIDGIAFQTNILALNAAVEAARAGEQGRGFAVVASEVRNLAQRSAGAAKEIKELINDSVDKVAEGSRLVDQAGSTMSEVVDSVKRVSDIISEITAAGLEQSAGISQINDAVSEMDTLTQQNAALVEQAAAAAASLQDQAQRLTEVVSVFKLDAAHENESHQPVPRSTVAKTTSKPAVKKVSTSASKGHQPAARALPKPASANQSHPVKKSTSSAGAADEWEEF